MEAPQINRLMTAVVQVQDAEPAIRRLSRLGFTVIQLASSGGFLGARNVTLLIGLSAGQEEKVVHLLQKVCRRRVEYVTTSLEGAPFHLPLSTPITVGGATIFTLTVEHFEEF